MLYDKKLYNYQKQVVDKAVEFSKFFLALSPGLGKTITSLAIAEKKYAKKILVICQQSKLDDWAEEIESNLSMKTSILNKGKVKDNKILDEFKEGALVASYETIWRREDVLYMLDSDWTLIIDESQYLKSRKSERGKWGLKASSLVGNVILLSGTPLNKPEDLYTQMKMLGMSMDWNEFADMFLIETEQKYPGARWPVKVISGYKNQDILFKAFDAQSYSMKTEEALDLPMQVFTDINLSLGEKELKKYKQIQKDMVYEDLLIPSHGVLFLRLRQFASGYIEEYKGISSHKMIALQELLETNENNFNIFYNFKQELADIKEVCKNMNIKVFEFNGDTKNGYDSREHDGRFIIASQYQSASAGLNLQHISNQLYYSPPLSFIDYKQSMARIHRVNQDKTCFYYFFKTKKTIEERIYQALKTGQDYDDKIFEKEIYES